ncbi:hypothetical protein [Paenibacillus sp. S150]|uniref:hypothetical protein n=1 Tax=Paenibacillus sp. S150 TaxID=2749826 RepID=UPI001C59B731|nr:hypothetical protein [Paenibacillus sp. S150]MBW4085433.1 hypothetical protein [Paenibacillus sp. S150]
MSNMTMDERTMLRDYILLPYMEMMVQKSLTEIEYSTNVMRRAYLMAGQHILDQITKEIYRLRRELEQRNIKILGDEQTDFVVNHQIDCRGYTEKPVATTHDAINS